MLAANLNTFDFLTPKSVSFCPFGIIFQEFQLLAGWSTKKLNWSKTRGKGKTSKFMSLFLLKHQSVSPWRERVVHQVWLRKLYNFRVVSFLLQLFISNFNLGYPKWMFFWKAETWTHPSSAGPGGTNQSQCSEWLVHLWPICGFSSLAFLGSQAHLPESLQTTAWLGARKISEDSEGQIVYSLEWLVWVLFALKFRDSKGYF